MNTDMVWLLDFKPYPKEEEKDEEEEIEKGEVEEKDIYSSLTVLVLFEN